MPALRESVRLAPNEPLIRIMLAQALLGEKGQQNVDEAITNLKYALARETTSATGYRQLAAAYARKAEVAQGQAKAGISWRRPSLHRPRPISMKGN